jgi:hypothetical protein
MKSSAIVLILLVLGCSVLVPASLFPQARAVDDVVILYHTIYQTWGFSPFSVSKGDYFVAGEVENTGTQPLHFNITAEFFDANSELLETAFLDDTLADAPPSYLHVLLPGKKSPFAVFLSRFDETSGTFRLVDHYNLKVTTSAAGPYKSGFQIVTQSSHEAGGSLFIEGNIKNIGTDNIDGFNVFATFYNQTGEVVAVASEGQSFTFSPNQTATFGVKLDGFNEGGRLEKVSRYELTAEGYDPSLWTADGQLISPETVYILGSVPTDEEPNPDGSPWLIYIAAIITIIVLILLAFLFLRKRKKGKNKVLK